MMRASAVIASGIGPAERAAVLRLIQHPDLDDAVGHASDARRDRGHAGPVVAGVADHGHVRAEQIRVATHELGEVGGGALLLALDQELDGDGHVVRRAPAARRRGSPRPTCRRRSLVRTAGRRGPQARTAASPTARAGPPAARRGGRTAGRWARPPDRRAGRTPPGARRRAPGAGHSSPRPRRRYRASLRPTPARSPDRRPDIPSTGSAPGVPDPRSSVASSSAMRARRSSGVHGREPIPQRYGESRSTSQPDALRASPVVSEAIVEAERARLPELDRVGRDAEAAPERWARHVSPGYVASNSVKRDISSSRDDSTVLCRDAQAPIRASRGRDA